MADGERILVVDDAEATLEVIARNLGAAGYAVRTASSVAEALALLEEERVDLVVTDLKMPGVSGLDLVRHVRENLRDTEVMMITGYASVESAVEAVKLGAGDYLAKPFTDEELLAAVRRALDTLALRRSGREGRSAELPPPPGLVGESEVMREVYRAIGEAAAGAAPVLVVGEVGTEKERVARAVHAGSKRAAGPFVAVSCRALTEGSASVALFGGAAASPPGAVTLAAQGTLFLDEVEALPAALQVRLFENAAEGTAGTVRDDAGVRIVAATSRDPEVAAARGMLAAELLVGAATLRVSVPALRQRGRDVALIAAHAAERTAARLDRRPPGFGDGALKALLEYPWPGNVDELERLVEELVADCDGETVEVVDLPPALRFSAVRDSRVGRPLAEIEYEHVCSVLEQCGGNRSRAAKVLGIDRKTLRDKLERRGRPRR